MMNSKVRGNFHHQEDDDEPWGKSSSSNGSSPVSTPRKLKKNSFNKRNKKEDKNPYASRGLDKFSALLADLEEKKQKIYSRKGSQDISLVRFTYSDSNDCVPIVVKVKKEKDQLKTQEKTRIEDGKESNNQVDKDKHITQSIEKLAKARIDEEPPASSDRQEVVKQQKQVLESDKKQEQKMTSFSLDMMLYKLRRPSYYLPVVIVLILLLLALSGRSFAILCTCIGWYIIPTLQEGTSHVKKPMKKKEYARRLSENKNRLSFPKNNGSSGAVKDMPPPRRSHRNSW